MTWIEIANTALVGSDTGRAAARGYSDRDKFGRPDFGIMTYSGGVLIPDNSTLAITGGGGAGAWAGNDWRGLDLGADKPAWRFLIDPSPASSVPPRSNRPIWTNSDGTPIAQHSYWSPQFWKGRYYLVGQQNGWVYDGGQTKDVWSTNGSGWSRDATLGGARSWDAPWVVQDPANGRMYVGLNGSVEWFDPETHAVGTFWNDPKGWGNIDRAAAAIGDGRLLRIGRWGASSTWVGALEWNLSNGAFEAYTLTGPLQDLDDWQNGTSLEYAPPLGKFVAFPDDGKLYALTRHGGEIRAEPLSIAGAAPAPRLSYARHGNGPRGRVRYVPSLGGIVVVQAADVNARFVRLAP